MSDIASLDRAQAQAVQSERPATLVVGGPGTGKSACVAHRVAHLLRSGQDPQGIVVLVPNRAAEAPLRERVRALAGAEGPMPAITTARRLGAELLIRHAERLDRTPCFVIHDRGDAVLLVEELLRSVGSEELDARRVVERIWSAKARLHGPKAIELAGADDEARVVARIFTEYEARLKSYDAFDRQDLACKVADLLESVPEVQAEESAAIDHLVVDDYHDLSPAERALVTRLAAGARLFVCGNEDQSVLDGAADDPGGVMEFARSHPGAEELALGRCYRGSRTLVEAANQVIAQNRERRSKLRTPSSEDGAPIQVLESWNERGEASDIERCLRDLQAAGARRSEIAIIGRDVAQFRTIRDLLRKLVIGHRVLGGERFSERKEVKDLLAYLKVIVNPRDLLSLHRIINVPRRGIGKLTLSRVAAHAEAQGLDFLRALRDAESIADLPKNSKTKIHNFCELIDDLSARREELDAVAMLDAIVERTHYIEDIHQQNVADRDAREALVHELQSFAREFCERATPCRSSDFLREASLRVEEDRYDPTLDLVHLMTVSVSRGLTFPHVILVGAEEGVFPRADQEGRIEIERRLFHVAMSRSSRSMTICHARNRKRDGAAFRGDPSRFIAEIPEPLREHVQTFGRETEIFDTEEQQEVPPPGAGEWVRFEIGDRVRHAEWGSGKVLDTEGLGQDLRLQVQFEDVGLKKLLLRYAKLEQGS